MNARKLASIQYDEENIVKLDEQGKWVQVSYKGIVGWVHSNFVTEANHKTISQFLGKDLTCFGGEPHWEFQSLDQNVFFGLYGDKHKYLLNSGIRAGINRNNVWSATMSDKNFDGNNLTIIIEKTGECSDDMADRVYPLSIKVIDSNSQLLSGCCK